MKFNIAERRRLQPVSGPYKVLTDSDLELLNDGVLDTVGLSVTAGETLAVECVLGSRYRLDEVRYYRTAAALENLTFFGKQGQGDEYPLVELTSMVSGSLVTVDLNSTVDRYEIIRVIHTVLTGSATVFEFEADTDDTKVSFGEQGTTLEFPIDSGTSTLTAENIAIYNKATIPIDFFCLLDADADNALGMELGFNFLGPFFSLYETGLSLPVDFPWSSGVFEDTVESSGDVVLSPTSVSGTYYTPVLDISSVEGRRFFWSATVSGNTEIDDIGIETSVPVVGVRFSDQVPTDIGWSSGQISTDSSWSVISGSLTFSPYDNNHILGPVSYGFFQARIQLHATVSGNTPLLESVGIEEGFRLTVPSDSFVDIYVQSTFTDHSPGRTTKLVAWFFESRNEEQ